MRFFAHMMLVLFIACCGVNSTEDDAAKADTHKLVFTDLNDRIVNGHRIKVTIEDSKGDVVEEGTFASLSVTLAHKCDNEEFYQDVETVNAVKGTATFTIDGWTDGECAVRATANGASEVVEEKINVGAEPLTIEVMNMSDLGTLQVKRVFTLKVKATTADDKAHNKDTKLHLSGHQHLRQFGKEKAQASVDASGVATFNDLYFVAPITTDIHLAVANEDGTESGTIVLTSEVMLQPLAGMVGSATFNFKLKTLVVAGLNTATVAGKIKYAIRNSDRADEHKIHCTADQPLAIGASEATFEKTTCLEGLKEDDLHSMIVDVLTLVDAQTHQVRSTPLLVSGN